MRFGMAHSLMMLAEHVVEIMFFIGLVGCASVVALSWISIFRDGFSDLQNRESDSQWEPQHSATTSAQSRSPSASVV